MLNTIIFITFGVKKTPYGLIGLILINNYLYFILTLRVCNLVVHLYSIWNVQQPDLLLFNSKLHREYTAAATTSEYINIRLEIIGGILKSLSELSKESILSYLSESCSYFEYEI